MFLVVTNTVISFKIEFNIWDNYLTKTERMNKKRPHNIQRNRRNAFHVKRPLSRWGVLTIPCSAYTKQFAIGVLVGRFWFILQLFQFYSCSFYSFLFRCVHSFPYPLKRGTPAKARHARKWLNFFSINIIIHIRHIFLWWFIICFFPRRVSRLVDSASMEHLIFHLRGTDSGDISGRRVLYERLCEEWKCA